MLWSQYNFSVSSRCMTHTPRPQNPCISARFLSSPPPSSAPGSLAYNNTPDTIDHHPTMSAAVHDAQTLGQHSIMNNEAADTSTTTAPNGDVHVPEPNSNPSTVRFGLGWRRGGGGGRDMSAMVAVPNRDMAIYVLSFASVVRGAQDFRGEISFSLF